MKKNITNAEFYENSTLNSVKFFYKKWADENSPDSDTVCFNEWLDMQYVKPNKYKWGCGSDDGYFEDSELDNQETFKTQEEAYESMKNAALDKVSWYADYNEVIEDCRSFDNKDGLTETPEDMGVQCTIEFHPHKIILDKNGCIYEYTIERIGD